MITTRTATRNARSLLIKLKRERTEYLAPDGDGFGNELPRRRDREEAQLEYEVTTLLSLSCAAVLLLSLPMS